MPNDLIKPTKLPTAETTVREHTPLGCMNIATERGPVHVHDGPGLMTMVVDGRPGIAATVGVLVYDAEVRQGLVHQMTAEHARNTAASLMRLANMIDPQGAH